MPIRPAVEDDAAQAVAVLRQSISQLCRADHQDDPAEIADWLANKTFENWLLWLAHPSASVLVDEEHGLIRGVGMVRSDGKILLNYVSPEARFTGVSKAILSALERDAARFGVPATTLESTRTAQRFYRAQGYLPPRDTDPLRMMKPLAGQV